MRSVRRRHFTALIPSHSLFLLPFCKCQSREQLSLSLSLTPSVALGNSFSSSHSLTQRHQARWADGGSGEEAKFLPSAVCTATAANAAAFLDHIHLSPYLMTATASAPAATASLLLSSLFPLPLAPFLKSVFTLPMPSPNEYRESWGIRVLDI